MSVNKLFYNSKKNYSKKQLLIDKLEDQIKKKDKNIQELEDKSAFYESIALLNLQKLNTFFKRISEICGENQTIDSDEEILLIINQFKTSTTVWRQKFETLCANIQSLAQSVKDEQWVGGQETDVNIILNSIKKRIQEEDNYCQTLKDENKSLKKKLSKYRTELQLTNYKTESGDDFDLISNTSHISQVIERQLIRNEENVETINDCMELSSNLSNNSENFEIAVQIICEIMNALSLEDREYVLKESLNKSVYFSPRYEVNEKHSFLVKKTVSRLEYQSL